MHTSIGRWIGFLLLAATLAVPAMCEGYKGRVVDGTTGQPIEGAYVIGRWEGGGGFVVSSSGCTLAIDRSNAKGEFELVSGTGFWSKMFGLRSEPFVFFYRRGYIEPGNSPAAGEPWKLIPDRSSAYDRIRHLVKIQGFIDCGVEEVTSHRTEVKPIYRTMISEATDLATTRQERIEASKLSFWLDIVEVGWHEARERGRTRWELLQRER
jgi:hypothetical protein